MPSGLPRPSLRGQSPCSSARSCRAGSDPRSRASPRPPRRQRRWIGSRPWSGPRLPREWSPPVRDHRCGSSVPCPSLPGTPRRSRRRPFRSDSPLIHPPLRGRSPPRLGGGRGPPLTWWPFRASSWAGHMPRFPERDDARRCPCAGDPRTHSDDRTPKSVAHGPPRVDRAMSQSQAAVPKEGATLPRELADFLVELSIAMHKTAIYPARHPLLSTAVSGVERKLAGLLRERPTLSIGVARRQLIIEGVATDPNHPLLRELAERFHRHHLGALRFSTGVTAAEVSDVLATVAASADSALQGKPVGLGPPEGLSRWPHVRLFPLTYEQLQLMEGEENAPAEGGDSTRAAQLWIGLARAALMAETNAAAAAAGGSPAPDIVADDPEAVAKAIDEHQSDEGYDQVI